MRILAIDVGSSSVKAGVWNGRTFLPHARVAFRTRFDGPCAEIDAREILRAVVRAGKEALAGKTSVDAISFCTFSSGAIVSTQAGKPLMPVITHADRRSAEVSLELVKQKPKSWWLTRTGNLPYPGGIGSSTLAWLYRHHPELFRGSIAGQLSSWLGFHLTGTWRIDPSQACFLGLYDIRRHRWDAGACRLVGISRDALPEIGWADEPLGGLTRSLAREWRLPEGIRVFGGFVDTSAAVVQTPMRPGQLSHNAGSTDVLAMCVNVPHPAEGILSRPVGVSGKFMTGKSHSPAPWLAVRTIASAGSALDWMRRTFFPEADEASWNRVCAAACQRIPRQTSLLCQPTFVGERASLAQPDGAAFAGIRLDTDRDALLQAAIAALVAQSAANYRLLAKIRRPEKTVYTMGGASSLAAAMHAAWTHGHVFKSLTSDSLAGLVALVTRRR